MEEEIDSKDIDIIDDSNEVEIWRPGKSPISFLKCSSCYLRKECPYKNYEKNTCALEELETINTTSPEGIIELVEFVLAAQAKRVLRFIKIEEMEGGFPDPSVSAELMNFVTLVEKFKRLITDDDFLVIKARGKNASGVLERLFGDIKK